MRHISDSLITEEDTKESTKRLKFGAASRPPYTPPRKTSWHDYKVTTTPKSVSRFKARKASLFKSISDIEDITLETSEDEHDPVTIRFVVRF